MYTLLLSNQNLEINKSLFLNPEENNSENTNDYTKNLYPIGKEISFQFHFEYNNYFRRTGVVYYTDINNEYSKDYRRRFADFLLLKYFDKSIPKEQWFTLYDVQFQIFEQLYPGFHLSTRLRIMDIFTWDLVWNDLLPLSKLVLRQIAELKQMVEIETINKGPITKYGNTHRI